MNDEDSRWNWHDQPDVAWAAGIAAVALIVLLVWAVLRTSTDSSTLPGVVRSETSTVVSSTRKPASDTTSYPVPSVQTSEGEPPAVPPPPDGPTVDEPTLSTPTSTTIYNPYATTTTQNGGAV